MADVMHDRQTADRSTAELVQHTAEQVSKLVRDELTLARTELTQKGKNAGIGVGLFGGGGVMALYGGGVLVAAVVLLLDLVLPAWLAALIVTAGLFALAGMLALVGKNRVSRAMPPVPSGAASGVRADVDRVKSAVKDRGRT